MRVEKLFKQLKREYWKVNVLQGFLDSIIAFQVSYLVLKLSGYSLGLPYPDYSIIAGICLIFFIGDSFYRTRGYSIEIYEEENPELAEILRTARDNLDETSLPAEKLFNEVTDTARKISSESIIPNEKILAKVIIISFLSVATVVGGVTTINDLDTDDLIGNGEDTNGSQTGTNSVPEVEFGDNSEVQGEVDDFDYQNREIDFSYRSQPGQGFTPLGETYSQDLQLQASGGDSIDYQIARDYSLAIKDVEN
ncbi:MAG: hypothetical protein ACI977_000235 [Candidatus Nanohaloarchaea archaeon]|jgi:hypothetical protein